MVDALAAIAAANNRIVVEHSWVTTASILKAFKLTGNDRRLAYLVLSAKKTQTGYDKFRPNSNWLTVKPEGSTMRIKMRLKNPSEWKGEDDERGRFAIGGEFVAGESPELNFMEGTTITLTHAPKKRAKQ